MLLTTGEGGAVFTADEEVIQKVSDARLLGVQKDSEKRYSGQRSWKFDVVEQGYRYHMSNIFAAIGQVQLTRFEKEFAPRRRYIALRYCELLKDTPYVKLTQMDYEHDIVPHIFALQILEGKRPQLEKKLKDNDIQYGIQYAPNHHLTLFHEDVVYSHIISIPMHPELSEDDIQLICKLINSL